MNELFQTKMRQRFCQISSHFCSIQLISVNVISLTDFMRAIYLRVLILHSKDRDKLILSLNRPNDTLT